MAFMVVIASANTAAAEDVHTVLEAPGGSRSAVPTCPSASKSDLPDEMS